LLPAALLVYRIEGDQIVPSFLGERDHPWIRCVVEERERFVGRTRRELLARWKEPLAVEAPTRRRRLAAHVLDQTAPRRPPEDDSAKAYRAALFRAACLSTADRASILEEVAARFGVRPEELVNALFADLPSEQPVRPLPKPISPVDLAARANLALARGLLARADRVRIAIEGNALPVVRVAKLRGLIVNVGQAPDGRALLDVSGPLSLFRHVRVYGRALGDLLPHLAWCTSFQLRASCEIAEGRYTLRLSSADPLFPAEAPRPFDSLVERRFATDVMRLAPDWDVIRDPQPLTAGRSLVFPDFALVHRHDPQRRWLVEIVGFWTPDYLRRKLDSYRLIEASNLILCIDERRRCADGDLPPGHQVIRYRKRIDPRAVLAILEARG
jgi:predicted nuclease of restriction endonuclease-like RecB superfamily